MSLVGMPVAPYKSWKWISEVRESHGKEPVMRRVLCILGGIVLISFIVQAADLKELNEQLIKAVKDGESSQVVDLLMAGASANATESNGWTALIWASFYDYVDIVQLLLDRGAEVDLHDDAGKTALIWAAANGRQDVVRILLKSGAHVNATMKLGKSALMNAAEHGHRTTVLHLLNAGADVNAKDDFGWTALNLAEKNGHKEIVILLKSRGASGIVIELDSTSLL